MVQGLYGFFSPDRHLVLCFGWWVRGGILLDKADLYYLQGVPSEVKALNFDPFRNHLNINMSDMPADMPLELWRKFRTLLPYTSINSSVKNLAHTKDQLGNMIYHASVGDGQNF
jgi:hypothetical protein